MLGFTCQWQVMLRRTCLSLSYEYSKLYIILPQHQFAIESMVPLLVSSRAFKQLDIHLV